MAVCNHPSSKNISALYMNKWMMILGGGNVYEGHS